MAYRISPNLDHDILVFDIETVCHDRIETASGTNVVTPPTTDCCWDGGLISS